jgi:hypothetical protein
MVEALRGQFSQVGTFALQEHNTLSDAAAPLRRTSSKSHAQCSFNHWRRVTHTDFRYRKGRTLQGLMMYPGGRGAYSKRDSYPKRGTYRNERRIVSKRALAEENDNWISTAYHVLWRNGFNQNYLLGLRN